MIWCWVFINLFLCLRVRSGKWGGRLVNNCPKSLRSRTEYMYHAIDYEMFYVFNEYFEWECSSWAVAVVFESTIHWYFFECVAFTGQEQVTMKHRGCGTKCLCQMHLSIVTPKLKEILLLVWRPINTIMNSSAIINTKPFYSRGIFHSAGRC